MAKERPILFSGPMVRAILECRKTQTRRVVKGLDLSNYLSVEINEDWGLFWSANGGSGIKCPYGKVGDRLWVRETWYQGVNKIWYKADIDDLSQCGISGWKPSIHMPRKASRLLLEITNIRVEQLQGISAQDAIAEGVDQATCPIKPLGNSAATVDWVEGFKQLWDFINRDRGHRWDTNPWVWVVEFKQVEANETLPL